MIHNYQNCYGVIPPQYIYANKRCKGVALDPPNLELGSWTGAGKALYDYERDRIILSTRPRMAEEGKRGFAVEIYSSDDGINDFTLIKRLTKEKISDLCGMDVRSIEGNQILKDPLTGKWFFYVSVDTASEFVWGGYYWQTLLLTADDLAGPWESQGLVLKSDRDYDKVQARNSTIDIVDGVWYCIYKAMNEKRESKPGFATSSDGIHWNKHGILKVDGKDQRAFLSGNIVSGSKGPMFVGVERLKGVKGDGTDNVQYADKYKVKHGSGLIRFASYYIDEVNMNLDPIFTINWEADPEYEYEEHALLGFSTLVYNPKTESILMYVQAMDPKLTEKMGINTTVERALVYEIKI